MRHMWRMGGFKPFYTAYRVTAVREGVCLLRCCITVPCCVVVMCLPGAFGSIYESARVFFRCVLQPPLLQPPLLSLSVLV